MDGLITRNGTDWEPEYLSWATKLGVTCFFHSELVVFSTDGFTLSYSMERYPYEAIRKGVMVTLQCTTASIVAFMGPLFVAPSHENI